MKYIQRNNRTQTYLFPVSLDASIDQDNEVRLIDLFVNSLSLKDYGFKVSFVENGRPAYHPADLLKLYIYGYPDTRDRFPIFGTGSRYSGQVMNKVRTSRDLEKECKRNNFKKITYL